MNLADLGWDEHFARLFAGHAAPGRRPARVIAREKNLYAVHDGSAELMAEPAGRLIHETGEQGEFPVTGDWVAVAPHAENHAIIHALIPRRTGFSRKVAWTRTAEQVIAANIDTLFLVAGLDQEFNLRRIERYVAAMLPSGAASVLVLNKTDLCPDPAAAVAGLGPVAAGIAVHAVSAVAGHGLDGLRSYCKPGRTVAFVGSSGVGKSTIINRLLGADRQATAEVSSAVGKGRHTTTRRELIPLPDGGLLLDTPGLRELQLWGEEGDADAAFSDIETLAGRCRYRDCTHESEPGCAIQAALSDGTLAPERFRNYAKLQREIRFLARRRRWASMKKHHPRPQGSGSDE